MKINIKIKITYVIFGLLLLTSCIKYKVVDKEYEVLKQLPNENFTKLELVDKINMDTVNSKIFKSSFEMKNVGTKPMKNIFIKGICGCTTISAYSKSLKPNEEQKIEVTIDLDDEKGKFSKTIFLYGTFDQYRRKIQIVGFRK
jgi:Protein of unknown function (DUF1573)